MILFFTFIAHGSVLYTQCFQGSLCFIGKSHALVVLIIQVERPKSINCISPFSPFFKTQYKDISKEKLKTLFFVYAFFVLNYIY